MNAFNVIGAFGISLSALVYFKEINTFKKLRIKQAEAFIELIEYIKNQVECFLMPIDMILMGCDNDLLIRCGMDGVLKSALSMSDIVDSCVLYVDEETQRLLKSFSNEFGSVYKDEQVKVCNYYIAELRGCLEKSRGRYSKDRRMYLGLTACFAASLILMLI